MYCYTHMYIPCIICSVFCCTCVCTCIIIIHVRVATTWLILQYLNHLGNAEGVLSNIAFAEFAASTAGLGVLGLEWSVPLRHFFFQLASRQVRARKIQCAHAARVTGCQSSKFIIGQPETQCSNNRASTCHK